MIHVYACEIEEAISLFNQHEYFNCHELLEDLWRETEGDDRHFYEGLIRLLGNGRESPRVNRRIPQGAVNLLKQGLMRLENYRPTYNGVDIARLYIDIESHLEEVKASKNPQAGFFERRPAPEVYTSVVSCWAHRHSGPATRDPESSQYRSGI